MYMKIYNQQPTEQISINNIQKKTPYHRIRKSNYCDTVSFSGHTQVEKYSKIGFNYLVHQTALGRELKTKLFVKDYIKDTFKNKKRIKIVSGGCSTGEEPTTYSMLLSDMRDKLDILGIDLGKSAIKQANSRKFVFEVPNNNISVCEHFKSIENSPYTDYYLFTNGNKGLTPEQQYFKTLFNNFFEPTDKKIRTPFLEWLQNCMVKRAGGIPLELDRFEYKLKNGYAENCKYVCGDVRNIDKILGKENVEAISFNNTLYHLTTFIDKNEKRVKLSNCEKIVTNLMTKFKNALNKDGLVIFGEDEGSQMPDYATVPKIMRELGFKPMNKTESHEANVWRKATN